MSNEDLELDTAPETSSVPESPDVAPVAEPQPAAPQPAAEPQREALGKLEVPGKIAGYSTRDVDPLTSSLLQSLVAMTPGVNLDEIMGDALDYLDPSRINEHTLNRLLPGRSAAVKGIITQIIDSVGKHYEGTVNGILNKFGGQEAYQSYHQQFTQHAPKSIQDQVQQLFDKKTVKGAEQAAQIMFDFVQMAGLVPDGTGKTTPVNVNPVPAGGGGAGGAGTSYAEMKEALHKALNEGKLDAFDFNEDSEQLLKTILAQRVRGKAQGRPGNLASRDINRH